ncbi:MAG: hypothetical protein ACYTEO_19380, partial [Planctomycetota bacterium]
MRNAKMTIWMLAAVVCLAAPQVLAWTQFNDGGIHDIDYEINDDVWVDYNAPGMETTVNLLDGGAITNNYDLHGYNDSYINIFGGSIGGWLHAYHSSHVDISGGTLGQMLYAYDYSHVDISDGLIPSGLYASDYSQIDISGGTIGVYLRIYDNSSIDFSGGTMGGDLLLNNSGVLTIYGSDFAVDGEPFGYGELASILGGDYSNEPSRHLVGTLANGDPL